jgi:hypothetical protein
VCIRHLDCHKRQSINAVQREASPNFRFRLYGGAHANCDVDNDAQPASHQIVDQKLLEAAAGIERVQRAAFNAGDAAASGISGANMWVGVAKAGYTMHEFPIFLLIFSVPTVVAIFLKWRIL